MANLQQPTIGHEYWAEHKDYPLADWQYEVSNGDTRCGYWEWVNRQIDGEPGEGEENEEDRDCTCSDRSWYGPQHDSACDFAGEDREEESAHA